MEMHCLEEYYRAMKRNFKERQEKLVYRLKQGQKLKEEEEEWLDGQGNLVNTDPTSKPNDNRLSPEPGRRKHSGCKSLVNEEIFELVEEEGRQEDGLGAMEIEESEPKVALPTKSEMCQMVSKMLLYLDRSNEDENQFGDMIPRLELFQQDLLKNLHFGGRQAGITDYFKKIPQTASGPSSENHPDVV
ncbi:hypothetical protein H4Q26_003940 [Puccinia striiformis f. sp. tritici PST-130]|nr:hypothetical protein H4Q26_003940 [Puccinia striiformis f. sp. tritici PST-130]